MTNVSSLPITSTVWNCAHALKNAGVGNRDYVDQITDLLFLMLADGKTKLGFDNPIPAGFHWSQLSIKSGDDLVFHSRHSLETPRKESILVRTLFSKALIKISTPSDVQLVSPSWPKN